MKTNYVECTQCNYVFDLSKGAQCPVCLLTYLSFEKQQPKEIDSSEPVNTEALNQ